MTADELLAAVKAILEQGFGVLSDEIAPDLAEAFRLAGIEIGTKLKVKADLRKVVDKAAVAYAGERAGELLKDFAATTPEMLRATVSKAVEEGWSVGKLRNELRENYAFSPARALTIARTETAIARRRGGTMSAAASGARSKHWFVANEDTDAACLNNQAAGWIGIDDAFPESDSPHPNCVCNIEYRTDAPAVEI